MARLSDIDPQKAKEAILGYCKRKGALVAGVADLAMIDKIAPEGHRPKDIMPRVKSVIRQISLAEAKQLLTEVMKMDETKTIINHVRNLLVSKGISRGLLHS